MNNYQYLSCLWLCACLLCHISSAAQVIYVNANANGSGTSWSDATPDLAKAIQNASIGTQIRVAAGTYYPTQCDPCTEADRATSFDIPDGVSLWGGYSGSPTDTSGRDWVNYPTILSGDIDRDGTRNSNAYNVIYTKNVSNNTSVDGFVITDGYANLLTNNGARSNSGAGWYNESSPNGGYSAPVVNNCTFTNNYAVGQGGAMHNEGGFGATTLVIFNDCQFANNHAEQAGGALYHQSNFGGINNSKLSNCNFIGNSAGIEGGALFINASEEGITQIELVSCNFSNNEAGARGGGAYHRGNSNGHANPIYIGCNFTQNQAMDGGAIFNDGGFGGESNPQLIGCYFNENSATGKGGALVNSGNFSGQSHPIFSRCTFEKNTAEDNGGGVYSDGAESGASYPLFDNCQFFGNIANLGGATYQFGQSGRCEPTFITSVFVNNEAEEGAALYNNASNDGHASFLMEACRFTSNRSTSNGGAMYNLATLGGEIVAQLTQCTFDSNFSGFAGAGMFNNGVEGNCSPILTNCTFVNNVTDTYGGAVYNQGKSGNASPTFINCLFSKNSGFSAGAIYNLGAEFGNSSPIITNCTFYANRAHVGGAIYSNAAEENIGISAPVITNCIFYKNFANFGDVFRIIQGSPTVSHCLFDKPDCDALYSGIEGQINCGEGLIFTSDPMFADTAAGNFHLLTDAPGIDKGDNNIIAALNIATDLDDHPRIQNGRVDLGVYEMDTSDETDEDADFVITNVSADQQLCSGVSTTLEISVAGNAPFSYQWFKDQQQIAEATAAVLVLSDIDVADSGTYYCKVQNANSSSLDSEPIRLDVQPIIAVDAEIFVAQNEICEGATAYFWTETAGGGASPTYDWQINGVGQNINSNTFTPTDLQDGDDVQLRLVSSERCPSQTVVTSNSIDMNITAVLRPTIDIGTTAVEVCAGETVAFSAVAENTGASPVYQWYWNDVPVGANVPQIELPVTVGDNRVYCQLTSSLDCVTESMTTSDTINVTAIQQVEAGIRIYTDSSSFCESSNIRFYTEVENEGDAAHYEWQVNGVVVSTGSEWDTDNLVSGDLVQCRLLSNASCVRTSEVFSNTILVQINDCITNVDNFPIVPTIAVAPHPVREWITLSFAQFVQHLHYRLYDMQGRLVQSRHFAHLQHLRHPLHDVVAGQYILQLEWDGQQHSQLISKQ